MTATPRELYNRVTRQVWDPELATLPRWRAMPLRALRIAWAVARDLADGQLTLRAMSLVYTTLLSLVPLLAVSFSVLKAFGVHNQLEPALLNFLAPMGEQGVEITGRIIGFVENVKAGVLGSLGLALLFYTVVSLMQKIERSFNFTWRVSEQRGFAQRFSDYLSVILIGPVLVFSALGVTATVMDAEVVQRLAAIEPFGTLLQFVTKLLPYLLIIAAFTLIYIFVPNTRVKVGSALTGAVVTGILWQTSGWAFGAFIVTSTKYTAIYSSFAILMLFMIWLYLGWLILLVGASIAFYHQHPEHLSPARAEQRLSARLGEQVALLVMQRVGEAFYAGRPGWTTAALAERLGLPMDLLTPVLAALERGGLLVRTGADPIRHLPARPLEETPVKEVLDAIRRDGEDDHLNPDRLSPGSPAARMLERADSAVGAALADMDLKMLALGGEAGGGVEEAGRERRAS